MHVCAYVYVDVYGYMVCVHESVGICVHVCACVSVRVYGCLRVCVCVVQLCMCWCLHMRMCSYVNVYV